MSTAFRFALCASFAALLLAAPARAWSPTDMFSSGNSGSTARSSKKSTNRRAAPKPGVVDSLTSAPKKIYSNTKALVTPAKKPAPATRQRSDTWKGYSPAPASSTKPSGIKSWFAPEPSPLPRTVGEWMKQKRVEP